MRFENLSKFFEYNTRCVMCKGAMPLYCSQRNGEENITIKLTDDKCDLSILKTIAGGLTLFTNENKYTPNIETESLLLTKAANFKKIFFYRKCHSCIFDYEFSSAPIYFIDKDTFSPIKLSNIKFKVSDINANRDLIKITNNLENKQTYLVRVFLEGNAYLAKHSAPVIVPLVNFNFDDPSKLSNKIRTILTLS